MGGHDDGGARHFDDVIHAIRRISPATTIEILTPDFLRKDGALEIVVAAKKGRVTDPERLRRLPETARGHGEEMRRLADDLRTPGRLLIGVPLALWRLREVSELVRPHAAVLPFLSVWFLTLSAIAAFAAVTEVVIALVLLVAAVL